MFIQYKKIDDLKIDKEFLGLIPRPSQDDYERLKASIEERGFDPYISCILTLPDGTVIDGYTRLQIAKELNLVSVPVDVRTFHDECGGECSKEELRIQAKLFIIQINTSRRHLNAAQKAEIALEYEKVLAEAGKIRKIKNLKKNAEETPEILKMRNADSMGIRSISSAEEIEDFDTPSEEEKKWASREAAKRVGIGHATVERAKKIKQVAEKHPEIKEEWEKAKSGEVGVKTVYEKAKVIEEMEKRKDAAEPASFVKGLVNGSLSQSLTKLPQASSDAIIVDFATEVNVKAVISEVSRVAKDNAHLYFIVYDPNEMFRVQSIVSQYFTVKDVIVWEMEKKRNGRSTAFVIKAVGSEKRTDLKPTDLIKGNRMELAESLLQNSTIEGESVVILNFGKGEIPAVAHTMKRKYFAVEEDKKKFRTAQSIWKELLKKARKEEPPNKNTLELVRWFWLELKKIPEEEFNKQPKAFFAREGKAAKELLKKFDMDKIKNTARVMVADKYWKTNGDLSILLSKWVIFSTRSSPYPQMIKGDNNDNPLDGIEVIQL